ncbi:P-type ATPase (P-ATPase) Superfamily Protein [Monocercomonoides exilis]|uniref:P-type ATPase (P-ATPase) Superfamily Protein n=1 Tax=Monocercomonoides exilis TaxID=2049356 RepID=UPI003559826A|nr:P-type ATPase (P-ATPase) Superfamily Protein [Monocercomonoides exilis]|eukprot:MONOS_6335.1-p1 / transcript=MONOS_6335.1 / gene=MONOS_6335 / organism=Monocercomonoides_exilis_PA203 / gene_product=P-type ATPase (P-ATPase) Superfamily Protein / transcript_product=P-type ATPase (P-ATPase) Superfamily Protein / location=Mono_scaffold00198:28002-31527(+) / protein_length=1098 / sequence_SO=supercontig / SO=protein_coding / is_pseudo=false
MSYMKKEDLLKIMESKDMATLEHFGGIEKVMENIKTTTEGLDPNNLDEANRLETYGKNEFLKPKTKSFLRLWGEAFNDTTLIILIVLAIISLIIAGAVEHMADLSWLDGTAILVTVIIVTVVSAWNTWSQERQFQKLNERQKDRQILVLRGGQPTKISIFNLLVGDIFIINTGDAIPADGLCIESHNISCDEAAMTGESDLIRKSPEKHPFMLCGCKVQTGYGKMVVVAVGMETQFGILKKAIITAAEEREDTPLQQKLDKLAKQIGYVGMAAAAFVLVLLIIFWLVPACQDTTKFSDGKYWILLVDYFTIAVSIIVMAVPEGLPLAVTIALAYSMGRMLKDNNLVRVLSACETMGGATTICSDKTGTLTQNKMKVTRGFFDGEMVDVEHASAASSSSEPVFRKEYMDILTEAICLNSSADLKFTDTATEYLGNVTECALLLFIHEQGTDYKVIRHNEKLVQTYPFSSDKKRMTVITDKGDNYRIFTKGASEIVSGLCNKMIVKADGGKAEEINEEKRKQINDVILDMASKGLRTIAIAYKDVPKSEVSSMVSKKTADVQEQAEPVVEATSTESASTEAASESSSESSSSSNETENKEVKESVTSQPKSSSSSTDGDADAEPSGPFGEEAPESDLILIGITGIKDPLRPEVKVAMQDCHDAHIVVRMVTGDNIITAMHIAEEAGIYDPKEGIAMEGPVFRNLSEEDRKKILPRLQVLARSSPIDKHTLVSGLKDLGHVVAVTGDGTNDAPALSKADVGFAMGITGTEVAKDASAIIITDDNFASIVKAAMWGRNVYDSIRKFIQFQLTVNVSAIVIAVFGAIFAITPLRAVQMLWVNLIMDTLAALALATETPTKEMLKRKPYGRTDSIICPSMWRNIIGGSAYQAIIIIMCLFLWGPQIVGPNGVDTDWSKVACPLLEDKDIIECSHVMFPKSICRGFLLDQRVPIFSEQHFSFIFNTFIWLQVFNWICSRRCYNEINFFKRIFKNAMFILIWVIVAALQIIIMLVPGLRDAFTVIPITPQLWGFSFLFAIVIVPVKFVLHLIKMPDPFNGEIPFQAVEGVPAGVYSVGGVPPEGCTLKIPTADEIMGRAEKKASA